MGGVEAQIEKKEIANADEKTHPHLSETKEPPTVEVDKRGRLPRINWCVGLSLVFFAVVIVKLFPKHPFERCLESGLSKPGSKSKLNTALLSRHNSSSPRTTKSRTTKSTRVNLYKYEDTP